MKKIERVEDGLAAAIDDTLPRKRQDAASCLIGAALKGNTSRVIALVDSGVSPNATDEHRRTPLMEAAFAGHEETVRALLDLGGDPNARDADGWTPLMEAASKGWLNVVNRLLLAGADACARSRDGRTVLEVAARDHVRLTRLVRRYAAGA